VKFVAFTVENYQSITKAYKLAIDNLTVITGQTMKESPTSCAVQTGLGACHRA